jgi:hypothetical protein
LQKARKSGAEVEVLQGLNCIKSKVYGQLGVQLKDGGLNYKSVKIPNSIQNDTVLSIKKKKRGPDDASSGHCSLSSPFYPKETTWEPYLQVHLMLDFSVKRNKSCMKRIPSSFSTTPCERFTMNDSTATPTTT